MRNPFIKLHRTNGDRPVSVNINNICHIEQQANCTYISLNSPGVTTIHVKERYGQVLSRVNEYYNQEEKK